MTAAHEIATGSIARIVSVAIARDPTAREASFAVTCESEATPAYLGTGYRVLVMRMPRSHLGRPLGAEVR
jgi:hypothetical protein